MVKNDGPVVEPIGSDGLSDLRETGLYRRLSDPGRLRTGYSDSRVHPVVETRVATNCQRHLSIMTITHAARYFDDMMAPKEGTVHGHVVYLFAMQAQPSIWFYGRWCDGYRV